MKGMLGGVLLFKRVLCVLYLSGEGLQPVLNDYVYV